MYEVTLSCKYFVHWVSLEPTDIPLLGRSECLCELLERLCLSFISFCTSSWESFCSSTTGAEPLPMSLCCPSWSSLLVLSLSCSGMFLCDPDRRSLLELEAPG